MHLSTVRVAGLLLCLVWSAALLLGVVTWGVWVSGNGSAGIALKLIETDLEHALLTALYTKGGATYARLWEHTGKGGEVLV